MIKIAKGSYSDVYKYNNLIYKDMTKIMDWDCHFIIESTCLSQLKNSKFNVKLNTGLWNVSGDQVCKGVYLERMSRSLFSIVETCSIDQMKSIIFQLLHSLLECNSRYIVHRDIKPDNILIDDNYNIKLCDFGLSAIQYTDLIPTLYPIQTIWYRAPEVLLNIGEYSKKIDIWSIGIVMIDLVLQQMGFLSYIDNINQVHDQMKQFIRHLGVPREGISNFWLNKKYNRFLKKYNIIDDSYEFKQLLSRKNLDKNGIDLLFKMLDFNPDTRISVEEAINHPFFTDLVKPEISTKLCDTPLISYDKNKWYDNKYRKYILKIINIFSEKLNRPYDITHICLILINYDILLTKKELKYKENDVSYLICIIYLVEQLLRHDWTPYNDFLRLFSNTESYMAKYNEIHILFQKTCAEVLTLLDFNLLYDNIGFYIKDNNILDKILLVLEDIQYVNIKPSVLLQNILNNST